MVQRGSQNEDARLVLGEPTVIQFFSRHTHHTHVHTHTHIILSIRMYHKATGNFKVSEKKTVSREEAE
jgi:hypothetical protein